MNENEKRILLPLAVGNTLLLISSLCKSQLGEFGDGLLCGMTLMCYIYAFIFMVAFFRNNLKHYGNR